jgi:hypothetical protein
MDERDQTIGFRVSAKERQALDEEATKAGVSLTEYVRSKAFSAASAAPTADLEALIRYLIYMINRLHVAVFSIPEVAGTLSTEQLQTIYESAVTEAVQWMPELPKHMAKLQAQITAHTSGATAAAEKGAA